MTFRLLKSVSMFKEELERFYILDPNQWDVLLKAVQWFNGSFKHTKSYNFITFVFVELLTGLLKIIEIISAA